jgi:hypothetical protein
VSKPSAFEQNYAKEIRIMLKMSKNMNWDVACRLKNMQSEDLKEMKNSVFIHLIFGKVLFDQVFTRNTSTDQGR